MSRKTNRYHGKSNWQAARLSGKPYRIPPVSAPAPNPSQEKILRVVTEFFEADATWRKVYGIWHCHKADSPIAWMKGMNQDQAKLALLRMGADYQWISTSPVTARGNRTAGGLKGTTVADPMRDRSTANEKLTAGGLVVAPGKGAS